MARPRVVIVGAGFGGLECARGLRNVPADITLLDRRNHHCFQPLLYQVATAALSPADIAWPIRAVLRGQENLTVLLAEVEGVDLERRVVKADTITVPFDFLVLATGATHSYFGHDEWGAAAPGLKTIEDATAVRRRILLAFENAELADDPSERAALLTFVVIGGGPTGVEMAGAIAEVARQTLARDFRRIDPKTARILLIEAGPRLLAALPDHLSDYARRALEQMGVEVMTGTLVTGCDDRGVDTAAGRISARTLIWAAGVVASPAARWIGAPHDRAGRAEVGPDLSIPGHPDIFAVGDTAFSRGEDGKPVPGLAPAAKQMGRYVASVISARIAAEAPPPSFRYLHQGDLATIGRKAAVVSLKRVELKGFIGWLFWSLAHIYFLIGLRNRLSVAVSWLWNYLTYHREARLITGGRAEREERHLT